MREAAEGRGGEVRSDKEQCHAKTWFSGDPKRPIRLNASDIVRSFICSMMWEGKKSTAQRVFYGALDQVAKKTTTYALKIFKRPSRT